MSGVKTWILLAMEAQHVEDLQFYIVEDLKLCSIVDYQPSWEVFHVEAPRIMRLMRIPTILIWCRSPRHLRMNGWVPYRLLLRPGSLGHHDFRPSGAWQYCMPGMRRSA